MDLLPNADQQQFAEIADDFLTRELPVGRLRRARLDGAAEVRAAAQMGWLGVALTEAVGGSGMSVADELLIFREAGKRLASPAVLATTVAAQLAAEAGETELAHAFLGGRPAAFAHGLERQPRGELGGGFLLLDGAQADHVVVWTIEGLQLLEAPRGAGRTAAACVDDSVPAERVDLAQARPLAAAEALAPAADRARVLAAGLMVGMAQACRDMAGDYAKVREQFGRPIGAFQAIKHKCADMVVRAESAQAQAMFAAAAAAGQRADAAFHSISAKIIATRAAFDNARGNIQVHGAMGFTVECDAHWHLKRAHVLDQLGGQAKQQQALLLKTPPSL